MYAAVCGALPASTRPQRQDDRLREHLGQLVDIARRTTAQNIEPYLIQLRDDVCSKCLMQHSSGHCPLRYAGACVLYMHARRVFDAIAHVLDELDDREYRWWHEGPIN